MGGGGTRLGPQALGQNVKSTELSGEAMVSINELKRNRLIGLAVSYATVSYAREQMRLHVGLQTTHIWKTVQDH
jgi:hypothetical protein